MLPSLKRRRSRSFVELPISNERSEKKGIMKGVSQKESKHQITKFSFRNSGTVNLFNMECSIDRSVISLFDKKCQIYIQKLSIIMLIGN